jgi:hypothetical protein
LENNAGVAVAQVPLQAVPGFTNNSAVGNGGNYLRVVVGAPASDLTIVADNCLGGALNLAVNGYVPAGTTLTLGPGVVVKPEIASLHVQVDGAWILQGTAAQPVVFTSFRDDSWGGDTNNDGNATVPSAGEWRGVVVNAGSPSTIQNLLLRYAGASSWNGATLQSPLLSVRGLRVDHAYAIGIAATAVAGPGEGWVAFGCGGTGIWLDSGSFGLRQASAVANVQGGIRRQAAYAGSVYDSIAWNNGVANYLGFGPGQLRYSDGDPTLAGSSGNVNVDPLFIDPAMGNLQLQAGSPCIDTGDPLSPPDPDATRADMGAYPFDHCAPATYCTAMLSSNGCTPAMGWSGVPSFSQPSAFTLSATQLEQGQNGLMFFGTSGPESAPFFGGWLCVKPTLHRLLIANSGGAAACQGALSYTLADLINHPSGGSFVVPGQAVHAQVWTRDPPAPTTVNLSNGLSFGVCP